REGGPLLVQWRDEWIRRRLRAIAWKQWKHGRAQAQPQSNCQAQNGYDKYWDEQLSEKHERPHRQVNETRPGMPKLLHHLPETDDEAGFVARRAQGQQGTGQAHRLVFNMTPEKAEHSSSRCVGERYAGRPAYACNSKQ